MSKTDLTEKNRVVVESFADLFYRQKKIKKAFMEHVSAHYIQHHPNLLDGREAAIEMLEPKFSNPAAHFDIKRILVDGDLAMIHLHARMNQTTLGNAVVDIFRLEKGKIVEHWDVLQAVPEKAISPHPMF